MYTAVGLEGLAQVNRLGSLPEVQLRPRLITT
jgi:hypothetical protein